MNDVVVTVVTVCRNAENTIARTIESILEQDFNSYEYIIIDGASTDNTSSIVSSYITQFTQKQVQFTFISEPDNGIWDAMNKAIKIARGDWIIFINADDKVHDNRVFSDIFENNNLLTVTCDVIYGDSIRVTEDNSFLGKANRIETMLLNMPFCHQCCFTRTKIMKESLFDTNYLAADYNFFLTLYLNKGKFHKIDRVIADYSMNGFSNQNKYRTYLSSLEVRKDHGLVRSNSILQKLKNVYFFELLNDNRLLHGLVKWIDSKISRRAI